MSGKGSTPRPFTDRAQYEDNFEAIFRKKPPEDTRKDADPQQGQKDARDGHG